MKLNKFIPDDLLKNPHDPQGSLDLTLGTPGPTPVGMVPNVNMRV